MIGDLHSDTCLLPKVALPKVQVGRLEADARASQLHPDACQNRQHLSCHCHLQKESSVMGSWFRRVAACLSACRNSKNNVAGVDDTGRAQNEVKLCLVASHTSCFSLKSSYHMVKVCSCQDFV